MRNLVETCFDVTLHDPLISPGREMVHLGHRVMSPAPRTEPVRAREKIRLEDRLQHQLQGRLDHPVRYGRDPQTALSCRPPWESCAPAPEPAGNYGPSTAPAAGRRTPRPRVRPRSNTQSCRRPQPSGRPCYPAPDPTPLARTRDHRQGCTDHRTCDEDHRWPSGAAWPGSLVPGTQLKTALAPDHRYSPAASEHSNLQCCPACWPPWPCNRLSRSPRRVVTPATTTGPPPRPWPSADDEPARLPGWRPGREGGHERFPRSPHDRSTS